MPVGAATGDIARIRSASGFGRASQVGHVLRLSTRNQRREIRTQTAHHASP